MCEQRQQQATKQTTLCQLINTHFNYRGYPRPEPRNAVDLNHWCCWIGLMSSRFAARFTPRAIRRHRRPSSSVYVCVWSPTQNHLIFSPAPRMLNGNVLSGFKIITTFARIWCRNHLYRFKYIIRIDIICKRFATKQPVHLMRIHDAAENFL